MQIKQYFVLILSVNGLMLAILLIFHISILLMIFHTTVQSLGRDRVLQDFEKVWQDLEKVLRDLEKHFARA